MNIVKKLKHEFKQDAFDASLFYIAWPALTVAFGLAVATQGFKHKPFDFFSDQTQGSSISFPSLKRDR